MAIAPNTRYPANTKAPDADYPQGSARDISAPGAADGTPLQEDWLNDWFGFQQAVLAEAGVTPSGTPDTALDSQVLAGLLAIIGAKEKWTSASLLGSGLSISGASIPALTALNDTDIAFIDSAIEELRTYRFDGTNWSQIGSGLSIPGIARCALATLNGTDVAFIDGAIEKLRTYRFDGSTWSQVGVGLSIPGMDSSALAALSGTDVALIDSVIEELRTYTFDGTNWSQVGSGLSIAGIAAPALAALNGTDVAFIDGTLDELRTYRFGFSIRSPYRP